MSKLSPSLLAAQRLCPVTRIAFTPPDRWGLERGVLARCTFVIHGTFFHRASIRRRQKDSRPYLAFPQGPKSGNGHRIPDSWPVNEAVRQAIELQVFAAARAMGQLPDESETGAA